MAKNTIRDILPPEDRPGRRQPVNRPPTASRPTSRVDDRVRSALHEKTEEHDSYHHDLPPKPDRLGKLKYLYFGIGALLLLLILSFIFSMFFGGATVTVYPKQETLTISGDFSAVREKPSKNELGYDLMTLEALLTKVVAATGREEVEVRASGTIIIYNDYNTSPQKLIRNTRFESPEGNIYRIDKSVVVPGQSDGKPGNIEVTVYADEPGEPYNIGRTDFTIPGFKGAPQFASFYAKSSSDMTGGFSGERLIVDDSTLETERAALREALRTDLLAQVETQIPEGFVSFDSSIFIDFVSETPEEKGDEVEIREKAVLYNVLFGEKALAKYLARNTLGSFDEDSVNFLSTEGLTLSPITPEDGTKLRPWADETFPFKMSGTTDIVWIFDEGGLKEDLSGRNRQAIHTVMAGYPSIDHAEAIVRPFWKGSFPVDAEEIKINIVLAE